MAAVRLRVLGDCVIEVNEARVDPSSTHLFALLLILALETDRRVHRNELQRMLFAADVEPNQASHNLRQLLYRVRRLGVELDETVKPRYEAVLTALKLRAHLMMGSLSDQRALVDRLWALYLKGRSLGHQDTIVEMLWCAAVEEGRDANASDLLHSYLTTYRREVRPVEWLLRATTAADDAWSRGDLDSDFVGHCLTVPELLSTDGLRA